MTTGTATPYLTNASNSMAALRAGQSPPVPITVGRRALLVVDAVIRSFKNCATVSAVA